jgi:hypothetical protein
MLLPRRRAVARRETVNDNRAMTRNEWQRRIDRAEELSARYEFAAEILRFYITIARFQEKLYGELARTKAVATDSSPFAQPLPPELTGQFPTFLSVVEQNGPAALREA